MDFFSQLGSVDKERLLVESETVHLSGSDYLLRRGDRGGDIYLVEAGTIEVVDTRPNPEIVLDVLTEGRVVGQMAFIDEMSLAADLRATGDVTVRHWSRDKLLRILEMEPGLAVRVYLAISGAAVSRLRTKTGLSGGQGVHRMVNPAGAVPTAVAERAREIAGVARTSWTTAEQAARKESARGAALAEATDVLPRVVEAVDVWMSSFTSLAQSREAGQFLRNELRQWLTRSHLGMLAIDRRGEVGAYLSFMAHLLLNKPKGTDDIGERIDQAMLGLPTAIGFRERMVGAVDAALRAAPADRPVKLTIIQVSCGAMMARLLPQLVNQGATITCVDGDPEALAFVDSGLHARPAGVQLRLINHNLAGLSEGGAGPSLEPQDVVVINGLLDHLPERMVGSLLSWCGEQLREDGVVIMTAMAPTSDARTMEHLLNCPLVRRTSSELLALVQAAGFTGGVQTLPRRSDHGGIVMSAQLSVNGQV
jgi:CRP-like cAMP-binding protein/2-polyprenyl-3-methyl-5-hydroxy-6-metoxy-1,4-benzoquinol methylase